MSAVSADFRYPLRFRILGLLVFGILLVLAGVFYRERTLFIDVAFQAFGLIREGTVQVQVNRFGAAVVQVLPLLAVKAGMGLREVLLAYSLSFPLLYGLFFVLITRCLGNDRLGWVLVFLFTLTQYDGFYWISSELQQGLAFLLLIFALVLRYPQLGRWWHWALLVPACLALAFYHPLVFIPFYFLWMFFGLRQGLIRHPAYLLLAGLMMGAVILKAGAGANFYDTNKYQAFFTHLREHFPRYFDLPSFGKFYKNSLLYWYGFPALLLIVTGWYMFQRQWQRLALVWAFSAGMLLLLHIGSPNASYRFYAEVNYLPLVIFVATPFFFDVAPLLIRRKAFFFLMLAWLAFRLTVIALHHRPFRERLVWLEQRLDEARGRHAGNRFAIPLNKTTEEALIITWGAAFESLLLTALEHPDSARTLVVLPDRNAYPEAFREGHWFISEFHRYPAEAVNNRFFRLGESPYVWIGD